MYMVFLYDLVKFQNGSLETARTPQKKSEMMPLVSVIIGCLFFRMRKCDERLTVQKPTYYLAHAIIE